MKKMLKFQLKDLLTGYSVYALLMLLLTLFFSAMSVIYKNVNVNVNVNGDGFITAIFCFALGIGIYKEHCQMAIQNSISRKNFFQSSLCSIIITCFLCIVLDLAIRVINQSTGTIPLGKHTFSIMRICYPDFFEKSNAAVVETVNISLAFLGSLLSFIAGFLIAGGYCRISKRYRTVYCIALPVFFCSILPVIATYFPGPFRIFAKIFLDIMGISTNNPFLGMLTLTAAFLVLSCICYRILGKTEIS